VKRGSPGLARRLARPLAAACGGLCLFGCGGGLPLLHPARALPAGEVRALAGFSGEIAAAGLADAVRDATNEAAASADVPGTPGSDPTYAKGALVAASVAPGIAPVGGARVGVGSQAEGGLMYTGRAARADLRRSFELSPSWSLSIGAGGSAALYGHQNGGALPNVDLGRLHGWGADVPLLVGFESDGGVYMLWIGARGGWEHVDISELRSIPSSAPIVSPISLSATRFWGGGLVGLAVGFRHVHVAMELDVAYASITGDYNDTHAQVAGVTLAPASALWWRF
jgi:hypothetical protein